MTNKTKFFLGELVIVAIAICLSILAQFLISKDHKNRMDPHSKARPTFYGYIFRR